MPCHAFSLFREEKGHWSGFFFFSLDENNILWPLKWKIDPIADSRNM